MWNLATAWNKKMQLLLHLQKISSHLFLHFLLAAVPLAGLLPPTHFIQKPPNKRRGYIKWVHSFLFFLLTESIEKRGIELVEWYGLEGCLTFALPANMRSVLFFLAFWRIVNLRPLCLDVLKLFLNLAQEKKVYWISWISISRQYGGFARNLRFLEILPLVLGKLWSI